MLSRASGVGAAALLLAFAVGGAESVMHWAYQVLRKLAIVIIFWTMPKI